jgi:hypothetical protein
MNGEAKGVLVGLSSASRARA